MSRYYTQIGRFITSFIIKKENRLYVYRTAFMRMQYIPYNPLVFNQTGCLPNLFFSILITAGRIDIKIIANNTVEKLSFTIGIFPNIYPKLVHNPTQMIAPMTLYTMKYR